MKSLQIFIFLGLVCCVCFMDAGSGYGFETGAQALIGFTSLDEDEIEFKEIDLKDIAGNDLDLDDKPDLSELISIGGVGYRKLAGDKIGLGVEYGGIFSGMVDDMEAKSGNSAVVITSDSSLFLLDLFLGPQLNVQLGDKIRVYGGVGPSLMIGYVSADFEQREIEDEYDIDINESDTAVGAGGYARLGVELITGRDSSFGIGVRGFTSSIDFDDTLGEVDFQGVQGFLTYTSSF